jgi:hypothetical protein
MHNDHSSYSSTDSLSAKRSPSFSRPPSGSCSCSCSCLSSSKRSYANHHVPNDDHKQSSSPKRGYLYLDNEDNVDNGVHHPEKAIEFLPLLPPQKGRRKGMAPCREQRQQSNLFACHLASLFQIWNLIC